jgi:hypothetical protein
VTPTSHDVIAAVMLGTMIAVLGALLHAAMGGVAW